MMHITPQAELSPYHTFSIQTDCDFLVEARSVDDLIEIYRNPDWKDLPKLPLGTGSNMLFTDYFAGVAVLNRLKGKHVTEDESFYFLEVAAGEDWPELVQWTVEKGMPGLENLALIPGCAGTAPIQNIGAYGLELKDVCDFVEYLDLQSFTVKRLASEQCQFGYRDSIFKQELSGKALITKVGFKLSKNWNPRTAYGALQQLIEGEPTAQKIFDAVCQVRQSKLPDPRVMGNAGSFFKNPVVSSTQFDQLKLNYPSIVGYPAGDGIKVAAGWLIDNANLKGYSHGGARVHDQQALVIVNFNDATAEDVLAVAWHVKQTVWKKYQIALEHEVRFMGRTQETNLDAIFEGKDNERL
ncbi:UDP-N-acetylmuramate dehydrogenase [Vibrio breoganii]|uniref:UDP-N-acetylmuramate dehydrogenase n=1 Tax=Vibrio breoganii TaxID=553239 RepID=UPI000C8515AA|nr:UDP-N-acetylmuramate dehydrogenase [Vibrio breoganii]PMG06256.1 UDP-N-acetylenolpyruvoylglucosamine reductase [Vibrio breoganii]PMG41053.1 UDP-N-acetylenolpyruvoylglucosamine reductase [Vibrio breoganii]PMG81645.1 UDP-N-acetylenolpyruvoylglucosamine reductase [Vibrio breoganii]PML64710.1 UDP-N-acetylenolpyruvoylglucosamine reductase [Vibrio breoganii]PMM51283.1 UDP-N-acetylenolpyruvoylglucosamine reductase [Vibrio breoganii]